MPAENSSTPPDWNGIAERPAFKNLLGAKASFVKKASIFFLIYYFALLVMVGYFPDLMKKQVIGKVNWAYLFALSQFITTWIVAFLYVKKASQWDKASKGVLDNNPQ